MKTLRAVPALALMFGVLLMVPMGCSNGDGNSPVTPEVSTRIYVMTIGSGVLEPASESAGGVTASDSGEDGEYFLTLNNVKEDALWYTDRPGRKAGETSIGDYVGSWADIYGEVAPNAAMDGYLADAVHAGLYLNLKDPIYDSETNSLVFRVSLLASSMADPYPHDPVAFDNIRLTVFDDTPEGQVNYWSFAQVALESVLEATGTEGLYRLTLKGAYPEVFQLQNAPGTRYEVLDQASLEYNWPTYFGAQPPNASLTGVSLSDPGALKLSFLELDNPSHDGTTVYYDARALGGEDLSNDSLSHAVLLIDSLDGQYPVCLQSGNEAKCYGNCFPDSTKLCCPKPDDQPAPDCGNPDQQPDWYVYTQCNNDQSAICTTYRPPTGKQTKLVIQNDTASPVKLYLQVGSPYAQDGACPDYWPPLQLSDYPQCTSDNITGEVCEMTLAKKGDPDGKDKIEIPGVDYRCTNGTITFEMNPNDTCGMSLGEFTLNVDPNANPVLKEGVDISLVNGNNGKIVVEMSTPGWQVQNTSRFVTSIENYETDAENQGQDGVYNYLCDACTDSLNPPDCSGPWNQNCSAQATCNVLRDGTQEGGTVTFHWKGNDWSAN